MTENKDYAQSLTSAALGELIGKKEKMLRAMIPRGVDPEKLLKLVFVAYGQTPQLAQCAPISVINSVFAACQVGLEFNTLRGHGWLVPRWNGRTKRMECQFQPGYRGLMDLAYRSGKINTINSALVYDGDEFDYSEGTNPHIDYRRNLKGEQGEWYAVYSIVHPTAGPPFTHIMRRDEVLAIRDRCAPRNKKKDIVGPWVDWEEAMALKTCIKPPLKLAPCSVDLAVAIGLDDELDALHAPPELVTVDDFKGLDVDAARLLEGGEAPPEGSREEQERVQAEKLAQAKEHFKGLIEDQILDAQAAASAKWPESDWAAKLADIVRAQGYQDIFDIPSTGYKAVMDALEAAE